MMKRERRHRENFYKQKFMSYTTMDACENTESNDNDTVQYSIM